MAAREIDIDKGRLAEFRAKDVEGWAHHVAVLDGRQKKVDTVILDRPIGVTTRLARFGSVANVTVPPGVFDLAERTLTPRHPYQEAPLSYLNASARSWSLWGENDRLEWAEWGTPRYGGIEFWFRNPTVGSTALVTIDVTAGVSGPGVTGNVEVRSSAAGPRVFPITGFTDNTFDLIVHPKDPYAVLVTMEVKDGMGYIALRLATYQTL